MQPLQPQLQALVEQMPRRGILYQEAVREFRKTFIQVALADNNGNRSRTAHAMGMHRNTLARHMLELGFPTKTGRASRLAPKITRAA